MNTVYIYVSCSVHLVKTLYAAIAAVVECIVQEIQCISISVNYFFCEMTFMRIIFVVYVHCVVILLECRK